MLPQYCEVEGNAFKKDCRPCSGLVVCGHEGWECCLTHCSVCKRTKEKETAMIRKGKAKSAAVKKPSPKAEEKSKGQPLFRSGNLSRS